VRTVHRTQPAGTPGIIARYRDFLPVTPQTPLITLGEGNTPLVPAERLAEMVGCRAVYLKLEGCNPTGSFKDRGMAMAVAKALERGARAVICASTGNTAASAAAFAARAGIESIVLLPAGYIARGKLSQALIHGARVVAIQGNFDDALRIVRELAARHEVALVNSINPYRLEGQKTAAFEVCDALGQAPDILCIPVGNAGNITSYWMGFTQYRDRGLVPNTPRLWGFEAAGAAPIVAGRVIERPQTFATAIRIGNPANWARAVQAREASGGMIDSVTDEEIEQAYLLLAHREGVFVEPASAAAVAGLLKHREKVPREATVVCVLTGSGLKDPDATARAHAEMHELPCDLATVERALGWRLATG
jgi:threonine synthase